MLKITLIALLIQYSPILVAQNLTKINWSNEDGKIPKIASSHATRGGTYRKAIPSFPPTFRTVGPESNNSIYPFIMANKLSLTTRHPNTSQVIGLLASHWYINPDRKTVFYKIDKKAIWSDGKKVKSEDFAFTLEFMRSSNIKDPWYNSYYSTQIDNIKIYTDLIFSITLKDPKYDPISYTNIFPTPKHYYSSFDENFTSNYNYKIEPNTGAYIIDKKQTTINKKVVFRRKKSWWGDNKSFLRNRFNPDFVVLKVVESDQIEWQAFVEEKLDTFSLNDIHYWNKISKSNLFTRGYINQIKFYNQRPRECYGIFLNTQAQLLKSIAIRRAIAYSLDFDGITQLTSGGEGKRLNTCYDGYKEYTNPHIKALPYDTNRSKKILRKEGFTTINDHGIRVNSSKNILKLDILHTDPALTPILHYLAEKARPAGISISPRIESPGSFIKTISKGNYQAVFTGFKADAANPPVYWDLWHGNQIKVKNSDNYTKINNTELNNLIKRYRSSLSKHERTQLSHKIQAIIHNQTLFIPAITIDYNYITYWRWWKLPNFFGTKLTEDLFDPFNIQYGGLFWLSSDEKNKTQAAKTSNSYLQQSNITIKNFN